MNDEDGTETFTFPSNCDECDFLGNNGICGYCKFTLHCYDSKEDLIDGEVLPNCPLKPLINENRQLRKENEHFKKQLKRFKKWINSDKNDYELTLSFIKNKGYSLKDVLEYEKELKE